VTVHGISGGPIENFREDWAIVPFVGSHCKPHYWHRQRLTMVYHALCGLKGSIATAQEMRSRGLPHAKQLWPFAPEIFMVDRCKHCSRIHQLEVHTAA
jgi:hypothetical protein